MWGVFNCTRVYFFWSTGADGNELPVPRIGLQSDFFCSNHGKYSPGPVAQIPWQKLCGRWSIAAWTGIKHPTFPEDDSSLRANELCISEEVIVDILGVSYQHGVILMRPLC